ncbi:MAG: SDR family NAD(P)-dependent oxidoreductase [Gammaproteobacteria bacterium]|nr:SDR family NAD(P)-dependent oxidoreductase [Gammaproteobacteria bacterium]
MTNIFITGNSNGLGLGLTQFYLNQANQVYSLSRSECPLSHANLHHSKLDLSNLDEIEPSLNKLLPDTIDLVILNAGILGEINDLADTSMQQVQNIMDINVWSNKVIIDWLIKHDIKVKQLILISSGASINGNRGWGIYSMSKAAINMMAKLYVHEMPDTHICAYAPGLVHTQMQEYLCKKVDTVKFPSIKGLVKAYETEYMPDIETAAKNIAASFNKCTEFDSGSFIDIRQLS